MEGEWAARTKQDAERVKEVEVFDSSRNFMRATSWSKVSRHSPEVGPQERASSSAGTAESSSDLISPERSL